MASCAIRATWCAHLLVAALSLGCATATPVAPVQPLNAQSLDPALAAQTDDDATVAAFLKKLEPIVQAADADGYAALEGPLGNRDDAIEFARLAFSPGATRVAIHERDRQEITLETIPGIGYLLTVDAFVEFGNRARVATWQLLVRRGGDSWNVIRQQVVSSVDNLFRLTLDATKQYDARNVTVTAEDLQLTLVEGSVFVVDTERGIAGLVLMGRGQMKFAPAPATEKGQVRILTGGSDVLDTRFDGAYVRVGSMASHFDETQLVARAVDPRELKRAQQIFNEESPKSFAVGLADLTRETWTLLPGPDDFLAEVRTRGFDTLTYARSASEPEDISLFERRGHRNIAIYPSKEKLAERGPFYNEDELAAFDVVNYDIDVTAIPESQWIEGRARMRLRVRSDTLGQLTIKLADTLLVRSIVSDRLGRLFNLRVTDQNTVLINLPTFLSRGDEITLTVAYGGRLQPQAPTRETLSLQDPGQDDSPNYEDDPSLPHAEPSFLYSNRSFWYPQSTVSDYATATIRLTVPIVYGAVASGEPAGPPQVLLGSGPADARHVYVFSATRPARYLSFIVSRFIPADRTLVTFADEEGAARTDVGDSATGSLSSMRLLVDANPRQIRQGKQLLARSADIVKFYQVTVGDAPYPSLTIALVENLLPGGHSPAYFAQLNQPLPNSPLVWGNDPAAFENFPEFFIAHEIAHQWWGQGVGWQNYHEQWLSEGFAQYFAALYANEFRGDDVYQGVLRRMRRWAMSESYQGPVYLGYRVGHIKGDGRAFRAVVYNKGAMVLHMLRLMVGDEAFFRGLRRFYFTSRFRKAGTEDFRREMEAASGLDLDRFFERWIYNATLPHVSFTYRVQRQGSRSVALLRFEQTGDVFDMPALVTLTYANGRTTDVLVRLDARVVERPVDLDAPLRNATISKRDVALADFR